jgi:hypothetical protein
MIGLGKVLIVVGILLFLIGLLFIFKIQIPFLGKLPGDISIKGENYQFYFPITTSIILSIIISFLLYLFSSKN